MSGQEGDSGLHRHIRGGLSHFLWDDDRAWGDRPSETYLQALARHATEKPDAIFLDVEGRTFSFAEIDRRATRMAHRLAALGVAKGDTVVALLDNSEELVVIMAAINRLGAIFVPINTAYRGEFLRHQVADADAALAICEDHYLDAFLGIADRLPRLERLIVRQWRGQGAGIAIADLDSLRGDDDSPIAVEVTPDDIACLIYTSGTTGPSKGCMVSHAYVASNARRRNVSVRLEPGEITWSCLPLFHIAALATVLVANLLVGERVAIASRFSVTGFWDEVERSGASSILLLASMLPLVAHAPDTPAMQRCKGQVKVLTGVPLSAADKAIWQQRFGVGFVNTYAYGQTEANLVTLSPWGATEPPFGSMGPPSEDFDAMVAGDDGRPVPIGEAGELCVRPRQPGMMFSGYWHRPEDSLKAMCNLWWHTGDFVRMDANGYLYFVDRKKDYLRSRGENISSFEVEAALLRHDAVSEVAFHTVPGEAGREEEIKATVVLCAGADCSATALFEWAQDNLPYFAVPRFIEFRPRLPTNPIGRVQKHELRAEGVTAETWDAIAAGFDTRRKRVRAG